MALNLNPDTDLETIKKLSSGDRMAEIMRLRQKVQEGQEISEAEVRLANRLIRAERGSRVEHAGKKKTSKSSESKESTFDLAALVNPNQKKTPEGDGGANPT